MQSSISIDTVKAYIPESITKDFLVKELISLSRHNVILCLTAKNSGKKYVIKILDKEYYNKTLYQKIFRLKNSFLLLPEQSFFDHSYCYFLYPHMITLTDVLSTKQFTYTMLRTLIADIGNAINTLHNHKILHLDITTNNIFMDLEGHFFLGDFSSCCFTNKPFTSLFNHSLRTGTTPYFAPDFTAKKSFASETIRLRQVVTATASTPGFWNDYYSFLLLLYILSNDGFFPDKKDGLLPDTPHIFDAFHSFLYKRLETKASDKPHLIKDFLSDAEHILELYDKDTTCQSYYLQISETQKILLSESTSDCTKQHIPYSERWFPFLHAFQIQAHSSLPVYGLLILSGCIFLFSLYYYLSQNKIKIENRNTPPIEISVDNSPATPSMPSADGIPPSPHPPIPFPTTTPSAKTTKASIANNYSQQILFANHRKLTTCTSFTNLTELRELYLHNNNIKSLQGLDRLTKLKVLVLSKNKLTDISKLSRLTTLTTLDLSHNYRLKNISSLKHLKQLQYLILTNTNITRREVLLLQKKLPHCTIFY